MLVFIVLVFYFFGPYWNRSYTFYFDCFCYFWCGVVLICGGVILLILAIAALTVCTHVPLFSCYFMLHGKTPFWSYCSCFYSYYFFQLPLALLQERFLLVKKIASLLYQPTNDSINQPTRPINRPISNQKPFVHPISNQSVINQESINNQSTNHTQQTS